MGRAASIRCVTRCCMQRLMTVALATGVALAATAVADDTPIAQCKLQPVAVAAPMEMQPGMMLQPVERPEAIITANYRQGPAGDWEVPGNIDDENASIRLLLATPGGPALLEIAVLVDDESFRATRERMIDAAFAAAPKESDKESPPPEKSTSEPVADVSEDEAAAEDSEEDEIPTTTAQNFQLDNARTRLRKYVHQPGIDVSRDEARWLLAQWAPGADLLELRPSFAAERAHIAPLWAALDSDHDNSLSEEEVASSVTRLRALDRDEDDWVDETELTYGASPLVATWATFPLITLLNETTEWELLADAFRNAMSKQSSNIGPSETNPLLDALGIQNVSDVDRERLQQLTELPAQLTIRVNFSTKSGTHTGVSVTGVSETLMQDQVEAAERVIAVGLSGSLLEVSAGQPAGTTSAAAWNGQVAVGAVIDGAPLLRTVDGDNDHQLSLREIDAVSGVISELDTDGDGIVRLAEVPVPIRLTVTRGPHAHELLRESVPAAIRKSAPKSAPPPDWFASMDRNKDNDLTPAEFLGTKEQFDLLDTDGDQRVSTTEALASASSND